MKPTIPKWMTTFNDFLHLNNEELNVFFTRGHTKVVADGSYEDGIGAAGIVFETEDGMHRIYNACLVPSNSKEIKKIFPKSRLKLHPFIQIEEKVDASEAKIDNVILPVTYKVPVTVEEEETMLTWTVDTLSEVR